MTVAGVDENSLNARTGCHPVKRPLLSLFALPKPFSGEARLIQENALSSWKQLGPDIQIMLAGDDDGVEQAAFRHGVDYLGPLRCNERGTPYLDHLFELAHQHADGELLLYANADILFFPNLLTTARQLLAQSVQEFLAIGRRWDLDVETPVPEVQEAWEGWFRTYYSQGAWAPMVCKDYFLFSRELFRDVPEFLVGRGNWDNWMVHQAKSCKVPVIDLTENMTVIHQNHGYGHSGGRLKAYVTGEEARHNERVGGGRHLVSGAGANWELTPDGRLISVASHWRFVRDLPRFCGLLKSFLQRKSDLIRQKQTA